MSRNNRGKRRIMRKRLIAGIAGCAVVAAGITAGVLIHKGIVKNSKEAAAGRLIAEENVSDFSEDNVFYGASSSSSGTLTSVVKHKVTIIESPGAGGTATDSCYVADGGDLVLIATPNSGYSFEGWYLSGQSSTPLSTSGTYTLKTVTSDTTITAKFAVKAYAVTSEAKTLVSGSIGASGAVYGPGGGTVTGGGTLHAGSDDIITLTATAEEGYTFEGWVIDDTYCGIGTLESDDSYTFVVATKQLPSGANKIISEDTLVSAVFERSSVNVNIGQMPVVGTTTVHDNVTGTDYSGSTVSFKTTTIDTTNTPVVNFKAGISYTAPDVQYSVNDKGVAQYKARYRVTGLFRVNSDGTLTRVGDYNGPTVDSLPGVLWASWPNSYTLVCGDKIAPSVNTTSYTDLNYVWVYDSALATDKATYGAMTAVFPSDSGTVSGGGTSTLLSSYQLTATPSEGYEFSHWEWTEGGVAHTSTSNPMTVTPSAYVVYTAYFTKKQISVTLSSVEPSGAGTITGTGKYTVDTTGMASVPIVITPTEGYSLDSWSTTTGGVTTAQTVPTISGDGKYASTLTLSGDTTISLKFDKDEYRVGATPDPVTNDDGTVNIVSINCSSGTKSTSATTISVSDVVQKDETIVITALPGGGASSTVAFKQWVCSNGQVIPASSCTGDATNRYSYTIPTPLSADITYTAQFEKTSYTIQAAVDSSCSAYGSVEIYDSSGTKRSSPLTVTAGGSCTLKAIENDGYDFVCWKNSAGERLNGVTDSVKGVNTLTVENINWDEKFTAFFAKDNVTVTVRVSPSGAGKAKFNDSSYSSDEKTYTVDYLSDGTLYAEASSSEYTFERWECYNIGAASPTTKVYTTNPLQAVMISEDTIFTAVFNRSDVGITVLASPASGGKVTKTISDDGSSAELKAVANSGYKFTKWTKKTSGGSETTVSTSATCTVTDMSDGVTYIAYFSGGALADVKDARLSITGESYYDDKRKWTSPSYSVTRDGLTSSAATMIAAEKAGQYADSAPGLKNYSAVAGAAGLYDDIEVSDDRTAILNDSELTTTNGEIMPLAVISDYAAEEALAAEYVENKFGNKYSYEILACKDVTLPEGFIDGVRTYLWRNQEVQDKDNIFILYEPVGGKADWVSCIVDEGDTLRFTIDSIGNGCRMTIVKVLLQ